MSRVINALILIVLYGAVAIGVVLLFQQVFADFYRTLRKSYFGLSHRRLLRVSEGFRNGKKKTRNDKFLEHLELLLNATLKKTSVHTVRRFIVGSILAGMVMFLLSYSAMRDVLLAGWAAVFTVGTPYLFLQIRRYHLSVKNSYEIGTLINMIVPEYRKHQGSMIHTLQQTAKGLPKGPIRRAVVRLTDQLMDYPDAEGTRKALDRFTKELGTSWAAQIANDIEHAMVDGVNVELSLTLMHKEFHDIESERKKTSSVRMDSLLVATSPFVVWPIMMVVFYETVTRNIFIYQWGTKVGFEWFLITLFTTLGSFLIGITFYRPKQDI